MSNALFDNNLNRPRAGHVCGVSLRLLATIGLATLLALAAGPTISLIPGSSLTVGTKPQSIAVGDFNHDGKWDLAVANNGSNNVSIFLGNGDGTFCAAPGCALPPAPYSAVGTGPFSIAVGDFNGDGNQDLVVANLTSSNISILLGNGNGTFGAAKNVSAGTSPSAVIVGDFNGDGMLDLAVANFTSGNTVSILLGHGDGTFAAPKSFAAGSFPRWLAAGDFNSDGKLDLAVANSTGVSVLLGNGDGTFGAARTFVGGLSPFSVAIGDFDGDGILDLAVANNVSNDVSIFLGNSLLGKGDGTFRFVRSLAAPTGGAPFAVALGDLNGDGKLDVVVTNSAGTVNTVSVFAGNGDGTFEVARNFSAGSQPKGVVIWDFNGDGKPDVADASFNSNTVGLLMNSTVTVTPVLTQVNPNSGQQGQANLNVVLTGQFTNFVNGKSVASFSGAGITVNSTSVTDATHATANLTIAANATPGARNATVTTGAEVVTLNSGFTVIQANLPPVANAGPDQLLECTGPHGAQVTLSGSGSDPDNDPLTYKWTDEHGNTVGMSAMVTLTVPVGTHTYTLTVDDGHGHTASDSMNVTVDDRTPPQMSLSLSPSVLWPPNHRMVEVTASIQVSDTCDAHPTVVLVSVVSNEPDNGRGDGERLLDIQGTSFGTDDRSFFLRAERSGRGTGRIYTVTYRARDASGNMTMKSAEVYVPHDRRELHPDDPRPDRPSDRDLRRLDPEPRGKKGLKAGKEIR